MMSDSRIVEIPQNACNNPEFGQKKTRARSAIIGTQLPSVSGFNRLMKMKRKSHLGEDYKEHDHWDSQLDACTYPTEACAKEGQPHDGNVCSN